MLLHRWFLPVIQIIQHFTVNKLRSAPFQRRFVWRAEINRPLMSKRPWAQIRPGGVGGRSNVPIPSGCTALSAASISRRTRAESQPFVTSCLSNPFFHAFIESTAAPDSDWGLPLTALFSRPAAELDHTGSFCFHFSAFSRIHAWNTDIFTFSQETLSFLWRVSFFFPELRSFRSHYWAERSRKAS